jgi:FAD:protein FMN transferase
MVTRCQPLLGTFVEITAPDAADLAITAAFNIITHVHARMSFHETDSDLARLRVAPLDEIVAVDKATVAVLRMAKLLHDSSDGLFDVCVGRALVLGGHLPRDGILRLGRFPGTSADIDIIDDQHVLCHQRLLIDLGGIAKGYAVDCAVDVLKASGVKAGLVNAGGDIRGFGSHDWQIQLRDADNVIRHAITLRDCAIASSANRLNRNLVRGAWHSPHIGRGGMPVLIDHRVSVVAEQCIIADAMTKVAMADPDLADEILATHKGYVLRESIPEAA